MFGANFTVVKSLLRNYGTERSVLKPRRNSDRSSTSQRRRLAWIVISYSLSFLKCNRSQIAQECDEWRMKCLALIRDLDRSTSGDDSSSYAGSIWTETPDSQSTQSSHSFVDSVNGGSFIDNSEDVTMVEQQEMLDPV